MGDAPCTRKANSFALKTEGKKRTEAGTQGEFNAQAIIRADIRADIMADSIHCYCT